MLTLILSLIGTPCQSLDYTITPFHSNASEGGNFCLHHKKKYVIKIHTTPF